MYSTQEDDSPATRTPARSGFMDEKLFKSRAITLFGSIDDKLARSVTERLLALASDGDDPITLYISSPGGHVESGDVIYDMIKFIQPVVKVVGTGWVASAATTIYLAAEKENRFLCRIPAFWCISLWVVPVAMRPISLFRQSRLSK